MVAHIGSVQREIFQTEWGRQPRAAPCQTSLFVLIQLYSTSPPQRLSSPPLRIQRREHSRDVYASHMNTAAAPPRRSARRTPRPSDAHLPRLVLRPPAHSSQSPQTYTTPLPYIC
jgi:hypothetical protein